MNIEKPRENFPDHEIEKSVQMGIETSKVKNQNWKWK